MRNVLQFAAAPANLMMMTIGGGGFVRDICKGDNNMGRTCLPGFRVSSVPFAFRVLEEERKTRTKKKTKTRRFGIQHLLYRFLCNSMDRKNRQNKNNKIEIIVRGSSLFWQRRVGGNVPKDFLQLLNKDHFLALLRQLLRGTPDKLEENIYR